MDDRSTHNSLKEVYELLQASSPKELASKFIKEDQRLLEAQSWDYKNPELVLNKAKELVESVITDGSVANKEDEEEFKDMLWFWYHHATGYAIWKYRERERALEFSAKALKYQTADNPNNITHLLYLLVRNKVAEATAVVNSIENESEKTTSLEILREYLDGGFFS